MIHRSLGLSLARVFVVVSALVWAEPARACLTTTCAVKNPPFECVRDPETRCWTAGTPLAWPGGCVGFSVDYRGVPKLGLGYAETEALVTSSFALWTAASCGETFPSFSVMNLGATQCTRREYNPDGPNSNSVVFYASRWPHAAIALGVTTVTFHPDTGVIFDTDVEVNVTESNADYIGVSYVLAHEAGHVFGIDHSADMSALMYERTSFSSFGNPPALTPDDVNAICAAYPATASVATCDFVPQKGYSPHCGGDVEASCAVPNPPRRRDGGAGAWALLAAMGVVAAVRRGFSGSRCHGT